MRNGNSLDEKCLIRQTAGSYTLDNNHRQLGHFKIFDTLIKADTLGKFRVSIVPVYQGWTHVVFTESLFYYTSTETVRSLNVEFLKFLDLLNFQEMFGIAFVQDSC